MAPSSHRQTPPPVSVSLAGFDPRYTARDLAGFLESVAGEVLRCRVKTTWTPPESFPDFNVVLSDAAAAARPPCSKRRRRYLADPACSSAAAFRTPPHAFVRFAHPDASRRAAAATPRGLLVLGNSRAAAAAPFLRFPCAGVEAGNLCTPHEFVAAWRYPDHDDADGGALHFVVDETCRLVFSRDTPFALPAGTPSLEVLRCDVKLEFPILDVDEVLVFQSSASLLLRLNAAPLLYYRTAADDVLRLSDPTDDDDGDPWVRTTDITGTAAIGRCWVYKISFGEWSWPEVKHALAYMRKRVPVVVCDDDYPRPLTVRDEPDFGLQMRHEPFCFVQDGEGLEYPVRFLANALLHRGRVNQHQLTAEFFRLLRRQNCDVNVAALTEFLGERFPVFDVSGRLTDLQRRAARNHKLCVRSSKVVGDYNVRVHSLVITPTRVHCQPPQVERSNRVLRRYRGVADRFLRVTFTDEGMQQLKTSVLYFHAAAPIVSDVTRANLSRQKTTVYRRVQSMLTKGFHMCGRKYSFLAFSSSQLRNSSAWFFADDGATTAASIREWMGRFPSRNVAKHAARMGHCFTSSYATVAMQPGEVNEFLEDVERNGYNFSDGIGKITTELAMEVAARLPLVVANKDEHPSAYQIRYAGFKGVVAVWPGENNDGAQLSLRPSMRKFESTHSVLEVVSWTKFQPGFLNRQIITLLTSLGVSEQVFWQMQDEMICNLDRILSDRNIAFQIAVSCLAGLGLMLRAGFSPATEPHLEAMLLAIRSSQLQGLVEKTKIFVPKSRWLMGCLDELGILEQGQCSIRASSPSLDNCFVMKRSSRFSWAKRSAEVVVGTVVVAKNPCLHPGDVRILEAVDVPELHHLVDCLVFPKKGERPHANEASGSDLDGDVYFVTWDDNLVPPGKKSSKPMDYSPAEAKLLQRDVRQHVSACCCYFCLCNYVKCFLFV
jgi:RNA-dependent RNA polymerase